ncbi:MAG: hypothetical protein DI585_04635 [Pseudomonas fluorescens]|nr:MAG: hypothetical protein DI585_04635 [Pseudomonas fluorescens]
MKAHLLAASLSLATLFAIPSIGHSQQLNAFRNDDCMYIEDNGTHAIATNEYCDYTVVAIFIDTNANYVFENMHTISPQSRVMITGTTPGHLIIAETCSARDYPKRCRVHTFKNRSWK